MFRNTIKALVIVICFVRWKLHLCSVLAFFHLLLTDQIYPTNEKKIYSCSFTLDMIYCPFFFQLIQSFPYEIRKIFQQIPNNHLLAGQRSYGISVVRTLDQLYINSLHSFKPNPVFSFAFDGTSPDYRNFFLFGQII